MSNSKKIYILIPTRNRKELLDKCLKSIFEQSYNDFEIVVVDDGSTDGTKNLITRCFKEVHLIDGDGNLWWCGAMRKAVEYVTPRIKEGDFILIQNDDAYMGPDYLENLVNQSTENSRMIVGTAVRKYGTKELIYNSHQIVRGSLRPVIISSDEDLLPTLTLSGRGVLIPVEVFNKIGNFSKLFPQYAADYDFFCRALKKGYKLGMSTKAVTYSTSVKPNLSKLIASKSSISITDLFNLFFSRRSSSNLWGMTMITVLHVPMRYKLVGIIRVYLYFIKMVIVNFIVGGIRRIFGELNPTQSE
jgi:GT2 family glycosyltransferase